MFRYIKIVISLYLSQLKVKRRWKANSTDEKSQGLGLSTFRHDGNKCAPLPAPVNRETASNTEFCWFNWKIV
jgi:hypothetical protein